MSVVYYGGAMTPKPFPHHVRDGLFDLTFARECALAFPNPGTRWRARTHLHSRKMTFDILEDFPSALREAVTLLSSPWTCSWLARLLGLDKVEPDPLLFGGGLHVSGPGDFLDIHADFSHHPVTGLARVANLLLYLTPDWRDDWGGHLELWDANVKRCVTKIAPTFNRAVIFATSPTSFHGHPTPLKCPEGVSRNSLALYYYAAVDRPRIATTDYRPRPTDFTKRIRKSARRIVNHLRRRA